MKNDPLVPPSPEFLGEASVLVRAVPPRKALVVESGNVAQMRRAMQAAAALWGGMRCPILPVDPDGSVAPLWLQASEVLGVSGGVDFTWQDTGKSAWTKDPSSWPLRESRQLDDATFWSPHPLLAEYSHSYDKTVVLPQDDSLLDVAGAGRYGLEEEISLLKENGWVVEQDASRADAATAQLSARTALHATSVFDFDTSVHGPSMSSAAMLWVVEDTNSFDDALWFWNYRAVRPRMSRTHAVSVLVDRAVASNPEFQAALESGIRMTSTTTPALFVGSLSIPDDELSSIFASNPRMERHTADQLSERLMSRQPMDPDVPITYTINHDPGGGWFVPRISGNPNIQNVQLRRPDYAVQVPTPQPWNTKYVGTSRIELTFTSEIISGPLKPSVAHLYHHAASWQGSSLAMRSLNLPDYSLRLNLPTPDAVLRAALLDVGITSESSDKGQQLIGVSSDGADPDLFRQAATVECIRKLTGKAGRDIARQIQALRQAGSIDAAVLDKLTAEAARDRRPEHTIASLKTTVAPELRSTIPATIDELAARGHVERGLTVRCGLCTNSDFRRLPELQSSPVCSGCGAPAAFDSNEHGDPIVKIRLSSLMHTVSLNGGLAPLAAYALLVEERSYVEPGVNLTRDAEHIGETDIIGWQGNTLFAGEAKMSAGGFAAANVSRDVQLAATIGADTFLAICLETIPDEVRGALQAACEAAEVELRILDFTELIRMPD